MPLNASALAFINHKPPLVYISEIHHKCIAMVMYVQYIQHLPDVTVEYRRRQQLWHYQQYLHDTVHILYYDTGYNNVYTGARVMNMYVHKLCNIQGNVSFMCRLYVV